jgi:hypothetical protein
MVVVVVAGYKPVVILVGDKDFKTGPNSRRISILNAAARTPQSSIHFVIRCFGLMWTTTLFLSTFATIVREQDLETWNRVPLKLEARTGNVGNAHQLALQ